MSTDLADPLQPSFFDVWLMRWVMPCVNSQDEFHAAASTLEAASRMGLPAYLAEVRMLYGKQAEVELFVALRKDLEGQEKED